ncbi:ParB/RepB/Spo0J family partition protein [Luteipulveratus halotolerans]|uniref:Chromosome partitioning protein ParB n=1 Tax=Luteipulveratus halotolerans TaxID=1631356 RepID=A0A0L6CLT2_9MICO|nr:ParB/RepB/Spo0J family partition protein [Luteipulveratus halotolerans]KNX38756.1 chromosome partitioning protein ParB [Luteipulveratus halotolerans]
MSDKRRGLGRGLGALIPSAPAGANRPSDVFFNDRSAERFTGNDAADAAAGTSTAVIDAPRPSSPEKADEQEHAPKDTDSGQEQGSTPGSESAVQEGAASDNRENAAPETAVVNEHDAAEEPAATSSDASSLTPVPGAEFAEIDVNDIRPNPKQPRQVFDEDEMAELVHSIGEIGVLQPIVVRPVPAAEREADGEGRAYELIMGERRWRASKEAGKATVPAIIRSTTDDDLLRDALLENLHRAQLNPLEEAAAYQQLLDDFGCTHDQLAGRIGRSRPQISNTLRLLKLPPLVQRRVAAGVLSAGHARALLGLADGAAMERLAQRIVAEGLSVRTVEEIVALGGDHEKASRRTSPRMGNRHPHLEDIASRLSDRLDTRVAISLGKRKGKLTVEFASVDDLDRIVQQLGIERS